MNVRSVAGYHRQFSYIGTITGSLSAIFSRIRSDFGVDQTFVDQSQLDIKEPQLQPTDDDKPKSEETCGVMRHPMPS